MRYLGDYAEDSTLSFCWEAIATGGTVKVYKDDDVAQSVAGITDTRVFDTLTSINNCKIDLSSDAFYAVGSDYSVVLVGALIDGDSINYVIATFSIENRVVGDFAEDTQFCFCWQSIATVGVIRVYKNDDLTQSVAGITDTRNFDGLTGINNCKIDLSAAAFYAAGYDYSVVLAGADVDGESVNYVLDTFSIRNRSGRAVAPSGNSTIEMALYAILAEDAGIITMVGSRTYPNVIPQNTAVPALTYQQISGPRLASADGPMGLAHCNFQVNCWDDSYGTVRELSDVVRNCLDGYSGTVDGRIIHNISLQNEGDMPEIDVSSEELTRFGKYLEFTVWFEETA